MEKNKQKIDCDIIQDLIPSYVDGICSDATRRCVEEHVESCEDCRKMAALCREDGIKGGQKEQPVLDGLKKIRQLIWRKGVCCGVLAGFILVYIGISMLLGLDLGLFSTRFHLMLCVTCNCLVLLSGLGFQEKGMPGKWDIAEGVLALAVVCYLLALNVHFLMRLQDGAEKIHGMALRETGPFLAGQMTIGYWVAAVAFFCHLMSVIRRGRRCNWLLCLDVTVCHVILGWTLLLFRMSERETVVNLFVKGAAEIGAVGLLGTAASVLIGKRCRKKMLP